MPSEATGKIELAQPLDYERERTINFYVLGRVRTLNTAMHPPTMIIKLRKRRY